MCLTFDRLILPAPGPVLWDAPTPLILTTHMNKECVSSRVRHSELTNTFYKPCLEGPRIALSRSLRFLVKVI